MSAPVIAPPFPAESAVRKVRSAEEAGDGRDQEPVVRDRRAPSVLLFDVNETLLDLRPLRASVATALAGRAELVPLCRPLALAQDAAPPRPRPSRSRSRFRDE